MSDYVVGDDGVFYFKSKQLVPYEKDWRLLAASKFSVPFIQGQPTSISPIQ